MIWNGLVRKYFPNATDELCDLILWETTSFPMGNVAEVENQLEKLSKSKIK